jgi:hypothetical protein
MDVRKRIHFRFEWRDLWVGLFVSEYHLYFCLIPCMVLIWDR